MAKWIEFQECISYGKTKVFDVVSKESSFVIGQIKWYSPFRKYSFFPKDGTVYEQTCLNDIADKLKELMEERKK